MSRYLGLNVAGMNYFSPEVAPLNIMKTAVGWSGGNFGSFTGSIDNGSGAPGNILTVTSISGCCIGNGSTILSPAAGNTIVTFPQLSGTTGLTGTYTVSGAPQLLTSQTLTVAGGGANFVSLDSNGYPTGVPSLLANIQALLLRFSSEQAGTYVGFYDGAGTAGWIDDAVQVSSGTYGSLAGSSSVVSSTTTRIIYTVTPSQGVRALISSSDPMSVGNNIRNMGLVYSPGSDATHVGPREQALLNGELFDPDWKARVSPFRRIRFTNWMFVNEVPADPSNTAPWSARSLPSMAFWNWDSSGVYATGSLTAGVPVEIMCAVCNEIGADAHFNLPSMANATYHTSMATLVKSLLKPTLKVWIELALEVWNFGYSYVYDYYLEAKSIAFFTQPAWQATHLYNVNDIVIFSNGVYGVCSISGTSGGSSPTPAEPVPGPSGFPVTDGTVTWQSAAPGLGWVYFANQVVLMADQWRAVYGTDAPSRLVTMFGGFTFGFNAPGGTGYNLNLLTSTKTTNGGTGTWAGNVASHVDAMCIAPYFGGYDNSACVTLDDVFKEIFSGGVVPGGPVGGALAQIISVIPNHVADMNTVSAFNGLAPRLEGYECGQSLPGYDGVNSHFQLNAAANNDPRMGVATLQFLNSLVTAGLPDFNYYDSIGGVGSFGFWPALPDQVTAATTPKYLALLNFINQVSAIPAQGLIAHQNVIML